jgi:hypothetical protein
MKRSKLAAISYNNPVFDSNVSVSKLQDENKTYVLFDAGICTGVDIIKALVLGILCCTLRKVFSGSSITTGQGALYTLCSTLNSRQQHSFPAYVSLLHHCRSVYVGHYTY